jgi:predicted dehydrogenase
MSDIFGAVVGTGFIGPVHVEALRRLGRPMVGVVGSSPEKSQAAARRLNTSRSYATFDDLLVDPRVHVIHLATPNHLHFEQCRRALLAGKHVICEKPLALLSTQTAELVRLARDAKRVAAVCFNVRFYPLCLEVRQRIGTGRIGSVYHVTGSYVQDWLLNESDFNWRVLGDQGGALRAMADIGSHWLDLITYLTNQEVTALCADLRTFLPQRWRPTTDVVTFDTPSNVTADMESVEVSTEDYGAVLLRFRGGACGAFHVSQVTAGRKNFLSFEIAGSRSALAWDSESPNELWVGHRDRPNELLLRDPALLQSSVRPFANHPGGHAEGFPDTFKQLFRAVYDYIEQGDFDAPRPFPTFEDGHRQALFGEAILRSHRSQAWVGL